MELGGCENHSKGVQLPLVGSSFSQLSEMSLLGRQQLLATFPARFLTDFLGKPAEKIANSDYVMVRHLEIGHKNRLQASTLQS